MAVRLASLASIPTTTGSSPRFRSGLYSRTTTTGPLLCDSIVEHGLLVSAYPPGTVAARHRLAARGGLLAALATATVVVEAGLRSGSRAVAATAAALGRPVMAVPGPVTSAMSTGCHDLLRDGTAVLVTSATDILDALTSARRDHPPAPASAAGAA
jgi:DNA processing protein